MAKQLTAAGVDVSLRQLGWRVRTSGERAQAVRHFQHAWMLGSRLEVDGRVGPKTTAALLESVERLKAGKGTVSEHFSFHEFRCKCGGRFSACARIWVARGLVADLEELRRKFYPNGLSIVSGCRCTGHNRAVGGATASRHLLGDAADIGPKVPVAAVRGLRLFGGLGYNPGKLVRHVDERPVSTANPTTWAYAA